MITKKSECIYITSMIRISHQRQHNQVIPLDQKTTQVSQSSLRFQQIFFFIINSSIAPFPPHITYRYTLMKPVVSVCNPPTLPFFICTVHTLKNIHIFTLHPLTNLLTTPYLYLLILFFSLLFSPVKHGSVPYYLHSGL